MMLNIGCSVVIYNSESKVLIAQRSHNKKIEPLKWENIGGHLEVGETPEECIQRETQEEIGCNLVNAQLLVSWLKTVDHETFVLIAFSGRIDGEIRVKEDEIVQIRWIDKDELNRFEFVFECRTEIKEFFKRTKTC